MILYTIHSKSQNNRRFFTNGTIYKFPYYTAFACTYRRLYLYNLY